MNGFEKHIESSQREKAFYFTVKSDSLPLIHAKQFELTVQQCFEHYRTDLPDPYKTIILVHAFYIEKITPRFHVFYFKKTTPTGGLPVSTT